MAKCKCGNVLTISDRWGVCKQCRIKRKSDVG